VVAGLKRHPVDDGAGLYEENTLHYYCRSCNETFIQSDQEYCIRCGQPIE
jgi:ribosomal protein L37E